jgi:hypothetical protein
MMCVSTSGRFNSGLTDYVCISRITCGMVGVMPAATHDAVEQHRQEGEQAGNVGKHRDWSLL